MRKLLAALFTPVLAVGLSLAQDTGGASAAKADTGKKPAHAKARSATKRGHKGGKKAKSQLNPQPLPPRKAPPSSTTPQ